MRPAVLLALFLLGGHAFAAQQVYKWTDANGVVHYTDTPPPRSANAQKMTMRGGVSTLVTDDAQAPAAAATGAAGSGKAGAAGTTSSGLMQDSPEARAKVCEQARTNLDLLRSKYELSIAGPDGKPQALDDDKRQAEIKRAEEQVSFYCRQ
jgi:hypothetical protein